jgi:hypothetical protein
MVCNTKDKKCTEITKTAVNDISSNGKFIDLVCQILHHYSHYKKLATCIITPTNKKGKYICHFQPIPDEGELSLPGDFKDDLAMSFIYYDGSPEFENYDVIVAKSFPKIACAYHYNLVDKNVFIHKELLYLGSMMEVSKKTCNIILLPNTIAQIKAAKEPDTFTRSKLLFNDRSQRAYEITFDNKMFMNYIQTLVYLAFKNKYFVTCEILEHINIDIYLYHITVEKTENINTPDDDELIMLSFYNDYTEHSEEFRHEKEHYFLVDDCKLNYKLYKNMFNINKFVEHGIILGNFHGECKMTGYNDK